MRDLAILTFVTFVTLDGAIQAPSSPDEEEVGRVQVGGLGSQLLG
ncbi:MAG: hypothetical protein ACI9HK_002411 [Pirellulaceae bacterium]|jgi:hypothetical protein